MADGSPWPRVSIVTPSFNQATFIEETVRSVLLQGYPNLEYVIVDGGSTDGSIEVIRKYERWLAYWVSEPDRGQSHAINKGWERSTGDILAWLNSDDLYLPEAIRRAVEALVQSSGCAMVYSDGLWIDEMGRLEKIQVSGPLGIRELLGGSDFGIPQPTAFMRQVVVREAGGLDESLHMAMDLDLWLKLGLSHDLCYVRERPFAKLRFHSNQKTRTRVLEDRIDSLRVLERALSDPRCPPVGRRAGRACARLCMDVAGIHLRQGKPRRFLEYMWHGMNYHPLYALRLIGYGTTIGVYRSFVPSRVKAWLRRARGTERGGWSDVRH